MRIEYVRVTAKDVAWAKFQYQTSQVQTSLRDLAHARAGWASRPFIQDGEQLVERSAIEDAFHVYFDVPTPEGMLL